MSIMQQFSKAQDRTLGVWFHPSSNAASNYPASNALRHGIAVVCQLYKFESRYFATSMPSPNNTVPQNLLDGQQRLTAFRRSMRNNY
jgi:hypothetical protein